MKIIRSARSARLRVTAGAAVLAIAGLATASHVAPAKAIDAVGHDDGGPKPTIVLEHGAWADASSWDPIIGRLQAAGYTVYAPPDPLGGVSSDAHPG